MLQCFFLLRINMLKRYIEEEKTRMQESYRMRHLAVSPTVSNHCLGDGTYGSQLGRLIGFTKAILQIKIFMPFFRVTDRSLRTI